MHRVPIVSAAVEIDENDWSKVHADDVQIRMERIKFDLALEIAKNLMNKMTIEKIPSMHSYKTTYRASFVGMSMDDWHANYGQNYQRRGISDGTMAVMQNGHWHIVQQPSVIPTWNPNPMKYESAAPAKPKPFDPSEYLKNKVNELRS